MSQIGSSPIKGKPYKENRRQMYKKRSVNPIKKVKSVKNNAKIQNITVKESST